VVTFDADAFSTTADLGAYVEGVIVNLTEEPDGQSEQDPRQLGESDSPTFQ
jgi:hypothetical protein